MRPMCWLPVCPWTTCWLPVCPCIVLSCGQILHTWAGGTPPPPPGRQRITHRSPRYRAGQERTWVGSFLTAWVYSLSSFHTQLTTAPGSRRRQEDSERSVTQQPCNQACACAGGVSRCEQPSCNLIITFHLHTGFTRKKWYGLTVIRALHIQYFSSADVRTPACAARSTQQGCEGENPKARRGVSVSNCCSVHRLKTKIQMENKQKTQEWKCSGILVQAVII